ncbi:hypothetical protein TI39_contig341g00012 [Zymoseptoria brevis]|uniref:Uncharacterized protein n=1 Tax=Zymoseptoria brevis TaxID=1047168 RepID=A0A0F4GSD3_9PEZI|nr:hypothetical protein TI39_contig341g00012 [Zymoseptoria brevis]
MGSFQPLDLRRTTEQRRTLCSETEDRERPFEAADAPNEANKTIGNTIFSVKKLNMGLVNLSEKITGTDTDISVCQDSLKGLSSSMDACSRGLETVSAKPAVSTKCQPHKTAQQGSHSSGSFQLSNSVPETNPMGHDNSTDSIDVADSSRSTMLKPSSSFLPRASQQATTRQSMSQTPQHGHADSRRYSFLGSTEGGNRRGKRKNGVLDDADDLESPQPTRKKPRTEKISRGKEIEDLLPAVIVNDDTSYQDVDADLQAEVKKTLSNLEKNVGTNWPWFTPQMHAATTDNKHCVYLKCQRIKKEQAWSKEEACPKCVRARRACVLMTSHKDVNDRHLDNMHLLPLPQDDRAEGSTTSEFGLYVKSD